MLTTLISAGEVRSRYEMFSKYTIQMLGKHSTNGHSDRVEDRWIASREALAI